MDNERDYYIAGGNDLAKVEAVFAYNNEIYKKWDLLKEKYGELVQSNGQIVGIIYEDGKQPKNWRKVGTLFDGVDNNDGIENEKLKDYYFPKRLKCNKEVITELQEYKQRTNNYLHNQFLHDGGTRYPGVAGRFGMRLLYMGAFKIGDNTILSVPNKAEFVPDGSTKLKMSQYWALLEEQEMEKKS